MWRLLRDVLGRLRDFLGGCWNVLGAPCGVLRIVHEQSCEMPSILPPKSEHRNFEIYNFSSGKQVFFEEPPRDNTNLGPILVASWLQFGSILGVPEPLGSVLGRHVGVLGASWLGDSWRVLARLGASERSIGAILGPPIWVGGSRP